jgi:hypothetical protein
MRGIVRLSQHIMKRTVCQEQELMRYLNLPHKIRRTNVTVPFPLSTLRTLSAHSTKKPRDQGYQVYLRSGAFSSRSFRDVFRARPFGEGVGVTTSCAFSVLGLGPSPCGYHHVLPSFWQLFWRFLATKAAFQRSSRGRGRIVLWLWTGLWIRILAGLGRARHEWFNSGSRLA